MKMAVAWLAAAKLLPALRLASARRYFHTSIKSARRFSAQHFSS